MVDAVLAETARGQRRVRDLPSRVVVYLLLAAALFADCGYRQVWARLIAGLDGLAVAGPSAAGLADARRPGGAPPLRAPFRPLRGAAPRPAPPRRGWDRGLLGAAPRGGRSAWRGGRAAGPAPAGVWWHGRLLVAIDGTTLCCPDTPANLAVYCKGGSHHGGTGYPMVRLVAVVACGTRALLATV